jgi:hypothetical protein
MPASSWCRGNASACRRPGWRACSTSELRGPKSDPVAKPSRQRRSANNKSARCAIKERLASKKKKEQSDKTLFQSPKRPSEYQGYRAIMSDRAGNAMPILIGAVIIASAILLSTLITAVGTRFVGMESPSEETVWLIDRLSGNVYKCQATEHGKAACEAEIATGSLGERGKR